MTLGDAIKHARVTQQMRQVTLHALTGLSQKYLSEIENGHVDPRFSIVQRIAAKLPLPLAELFPPDGPADLP
jgi:predicted transcriptional regulator